MILHHSDKKGHFEFKSEDIGFNALKYMYLYEMTKSNHSK